MSILIKGMEMPKNCMVCPLKIDGDDGGICPYVSNYCADYESDRHKDCHLVPVPEHGRLIDADALMAKDRQIYRSDGAAIGRKRFIEFYEIDDAPTIIPADKDGEG